MCKNSLRNLPSEETTWRFPGGTSRRLSGGTSARTSGRTPRGISIRNQGRIYGRSPGRTSESIPRRTSGSILGEIPARSQLGSFAQIPGINSGRISLKTEASGRILKAFSEWVWRNYHLKFEEKRLEDFPKNLPEKFWEKL